MRHTRYRPLQEILGHRRENSLHHFVLLRVIFTVKRWLWEKLKKDKGDRGGRLKHPERWTDFSQENRLTPLLWGMSLGVPQEKGVKNPFLLDRKVGTPCKGVGGLRCCHRPEGEVSVVQREADCWGGQMGWPVVISLQIGEVTKSPGPPSAGTRRTGMKTHCSPVASGKKRKKEDNTRVRKGYRPREHKVEVAP